MECIYIHTRSVCVCIYPWKNIYISMESMIYLYKENISLSLSICLFFTLMIDAQAIFTSMNASLFLEQISRVKIGGIYGRYLMIKNVQIVC